VPKYRKKPVVIEAVQFVGDAIEGFEIIAVGLDELGNQHFNLVIPTLEGVMYASEGDWIITGVNGEKYPCKPDIFEKTYEAVE
jgi:hypothetical protein